MARNHNKLSDLAIKAATKPGRYGDGGGLYLVVGLTGSRSFTFMWTRDGKRREMGLGAYGNAEGYVSLAMARARAGVARVALLEGRDPLAETRKETEPTFGEAVELFLADREAGWRNEKHRAQWRMTLLGPAEQKGKRRQAADYCRSLRSMKVSAISTEDVLKVLQPVWQTRSETASRLRGRVERVLAFAKVKGWRSGENPAQWRGHLDALLPKPKKLTRGHHRALPFTDMPGFYQRLIGRPGLSARAIEFVLLTVARSGEALGATWDEVDLDAALWTVPAGRMKATRPHVVPLVPSAVAILKDLAEMRQNDFVFPGERRDRPLTAKALENQLRRMKASGDTTLHGFRSTFRDWAGDETNFPRDVAEMALAHKVGDETEQAYRRLTALAKRRKLMTAWADFIAKGEGGGGKVTDFLAAKAQRRVAGQA
ncbi:site-specific integrase [Mesorhizobium sp.]|uniref:tyrosine-type recombinase/integrase n=1 Tax=Mesorhizobium sp. TaxID=1871066 RepID=UPI0011FF9B67|nr:site-specific integrase [Mesorhizobium sp.]TIM38306.1 MAG: DUF4102 domain-containing protein [Mesorhizobium sp.]